MAFLRKVQITHYVDANGKRVTKNTPGSRPVTTESKKWYIFWMENGKKKSAPGYVDKQASYAKMTKLIKAQERGEAGLTDPFKADLDRQATAHLDEYLSVLRERVRDDKYFGETTRILRNMLTTCQVDLLRDLTAGGIEDYLTSMKTAPNTRKKHHSAMSGFVKWLFKRKRIERNFMLSVDVPTGTVVTKLRSLNVDELQQLLIVARSRPLRDAQLIRQGKRKGTLLARVTPEVQKAREHEGRERGLLYKTAMLTALRKAELARIRVGFLNFKDKPYPTLHLPGTATKNKREAKMYLVPSLGEELHQWVIDTAKGEEDFLFAVPDKLNLIFQHDLKMAKIPVKDGKGAVAKFRSLRKSANMLLSRAGVPAQLRMLFMRHSDIRLTTQTYDDTTLMEMGKEVIPALERVDLR